MGARRYMTAVGFMVLGTALGVALGARSGTAQSTSSADVAIATDGNGAWVVRGDKLVLCRRKLIQPATAQPPDVECGRPVTLP